MANVTGSGAGLASTRVRRLKPPLGHLSSETTRASRFTRQMAEPRLQPRIRRGGG
jgi:hypothetical protein